MKTAATYALWMSVGLGAGMALAALFFVACNATAGVAVAPGANEGLMWAWLVAEMLAPVAGIIAGAVLAWRLNRRPPGP